MQLFEDFLSPEAVITAVRPQEGQQVADFHARSGFFTRAAARAVGPAGRVWAIDPERDMLVRLKNTAELEGLQNVEVVRGNIERVRGTLLPEEGMDLVLLVNALCTVEDKSSTVAEAARVLKKGGRLLVIDWADTFGGLGPHPDHRVVEHDARAALEAGGFVLADSVPAGSHHWGFLARKI